MSDVDIAALQKSLNKDAGGATLPAYHRAVPVHNLQPGQSMVVRLLGDKDPAAVPFVEQEVYRFRYPGTVNGEDGDTDEPVIVNVPCIASWGRVCPIKLAHKQDWKGSDERKALAKRFYPTRYYNYQGFVCSSPLVERDEVINPIRRFRFGRQMQDTLMAGLNNGGMEWSPFGSEKGRDATLKKTLQGGFNNYSSSTWSFRERPLNQAERDAIATHGLFELTEFLGPEPDDEGEAMIWALYQASLRDEPFDYNRFGHHYRAWPELPAQGSVAPFVPPTTPAARPALDEHGQSMLAQLKGRTRATTTTTAA